MRKINALIRYEIIDIKRGILIWVIAALYIFGIQQVFTSMRLSGETFISVVGLIKVSWLPLNLIMVPILLLGMKVGQSSNEIFKTLDVSQKEVMISKILVMGILSGIILVFNLIVLIVYEIILN